MEEIHRYASENVNIILVGTKYDLSDQRVVSSEEGKQFADSLDIDFYETSANIGNVHTPFVELAKQIKSKRAVMSRNVSYNLNMQKAVMYSKPKGASFSMPQFDRKKTKKSENVPVLIDEIFCDLENMFYLLSDLVYYVMMTKISRFVDFVLNILRFIAWFIVYPLIVLIALIIVLPSCIFLLIVRMNKIESDEKLVAIREYVIENESCCQRILRLIKQLLRALFMFFVLCIYPLLIVYHIIPRYGSTEYVVLLNIGLYLFGILALQIFGTYRGLKSYKQKQKKSKSEFIPMTYLWNLGTIIAVFMIFYEINQMALFALHSINDQNENEKETKINADFEELSIFNQQIRSVLTKISFFVVYNIEHIPIFDVYFFFSVGCVVILILFFLFRFVFELRQYAKLKYIECDKDKARNFYFYSFCGTIIYGHGQLENVSKITAKIVSFLSDTLFLVICEKLVLILVCNENDAMFEDAVCWEGKHQNYAAVSLVVIGYYIPLSTLIAPMFNEVPMQKEEDKNEKKHKFLSMNNSIQFVKPFLSAITVTKCWMLITSTFLFRKEAIPTIICQSIACFVLLIFSLKWTFKSLNECGLTQNEPAFPFGISLLRAFGFFAAIVGCFVELLKIMKFIDGSLDVLLLFAILIFCAVLMIGLMWKYHSKFNQYDDDINIHLVLEYDQKQKEVKFA